MTRFLPRAFSLSRSLRRSIQTMALGLSAFCAVGSTSAADPAPTSLTPAMKFNEVREVAPGVFFRFSQISATDPALPFGGSNNAWVVFKDFVVVIDANFPKEAGDVIAEIRKITKKPIRYVFDTHHHGDHAWGNAVWAAEGAAVIGHRYCAERMKGDATEFANAGKGPNARKDVAESTFKVPDLIFDDKLVLDDGTQRVEFHFLGHAHTSGDAVAWLPAHGILCTGDACVNGAFNFMGHSDSASWVRALERMEAFNPKTILPGHGPADGIALVKRQKRYFADLRREVNKAVRENKTIDDTKKSIVFPWYKEWTGVSVKADNIEHVYGEMTGTVAPWDLRETYGMVEGPSPSKADAKWAAPKRIIVPASLSPAKLRELKRVAPEVEFVGARTPQEAVEMAAAKEMPADAIVGFPSLPTAPSCRWVHLEEGVTREVLEKTAGSLTITGAEAVAAPERAETAVSLLLAAISKANDGKPAPAMLAGKLALVLGDGPASRVLGRRLGIMGVRSILVEDGSGETPQGFSKRAAREELAELARQADILILCAPAGTRPSLVPNQIPELRKETILLLLGPGAHAAKGLVEQSSTAGPVLALDSQAKASLGRTDAQEAKPATGSSGYQNRAWRLLRENVRRFAAGEKLLGVVDPKVGY